MVESVLNHSTVFIDDGITPFGLGKSHLPSEQLPPSPLNLFWDGIELGRKKKFSEEITKGKERV